MHHRISRELFLYYLKELKLRYNNRDINSLEKILVVLKNS